MNYRLFGIQKLIKPMVLMLVFTLLSIFYLPLLVISPQIDPSLHTNDSSLNELPSIPAASASAIPTLHIPQSKPQVYDVVIVGSELEGLYLARAAHDEGLRVKILDTRDGFGGQLLQAEMQFLDETNDESGKSLIQGRVKQLFDGFKNGSIRKQVEFEKYVRNLVNNIPIESGVTITSIVSNPGVHDKNQVTSLTYVNKLSISKEINATYWVDNSDHAALLHRLEVTRLPGLEKFYKLNRIEYMSAGMMMKFKNVDWEKFQKTVSSMEVNLRNQRFGPAWVSNSFAVNFSGMSKRYTASNPRLFLRGLNAVNQRNGEVSINALLVYDVDPSNLSSIQEAMTLTKKEMPSILEHFRNSLPGWENAKLNGFPAYPYIREYNHYQTDYVLHPSDLLGGKMFWDNVSIGGYPLDLQGVTSVKWGISMGKPDKYGMPLRSFLLKNYDNVIVAGKNVGSSAIAYGSTRIQPNTSLAAETIGIMLGQIQGKKKLKQINETDMKQLQAYIEKKYAIKLTGIIAKNKIAGWTKEEISKLDTGEIIYPAYILKRNK
jgi:hypothetical protein